MTDDLDHRIEKLAHWIHASRHLVVFTGAGVSTESGLPDFRGPEGLWTRRDKGLPPRPMVRSWDSVEPNRGHLAIVALQCALRMLRRLEIPSGTLSNCALCISWAFPLLPKNLS